MSLRKSRGKYAPQEVDVPRAAKPIRTLPDTPEPPKPAVIGIDPSDEGDKTEIVHFPPSTTSWDDGSVTAITSDANRSAPLTMSDLGRMDLNRARTAMQHVEEAQDWRNLEYRGLVLATADFRHLEEVLSFTDGTCGHPALSYQMTYELQSFRSLDMPTHRTAQLGVGNVTVQVPILGNAPPQAAVAAYVRDDAVRALLGPSVAKVLAYHRTYAPRIIRTWAMSIDSYPTFFILFRNSAGDTYGAVSINTRNDFMCHEFEYRGTERRILEELTERIIMRTISVTVPALQAFIRPR